MDTEKAINAILEDFEHQPLQDRRTFLSLLNNPELISLSSTNAQQQSAPISPQTNNAYFNFTCNLPRPAINAKSLQLLKAIIPQAQTSIPDYSLVFPYYRLRTVPSQVDGSITFVDKPSFENLFFVRLLPSYYKKEMLLNPNSFGYNETFNDYAEVATQLIKACNVDPTFDYASHYFGEDVSITYNSLENKFQFKGLNVNLQPILTYFDPWIAEIEYNEGAVVYYNKQFYEANQFIPTETSTIVPPNDPRWQVSFQNSYPPFDPALNYVVDEVVQDNDNNFYICIKNTAGSDNIDPASNPDYWLNVSQFFENDSFYTTYLIAGYDDPNVDQLLRYVQDKSTTQYNANRTDLVLGDVYFSSVPGNPYVKGQTLARRLGFTWDGTGLLTSTINKYNFTGIQYGSTTALFYNRIRPIPPYYPRFGLFRSNLGALEDSYVYTADGYCNLVYSSIINIYTSIIGTSSVDTQRDANLLGTIELNAPNLGIAMANNFIDTKLTKIQPDIYSIYIELRDENGVEYYLTNNATTTLLLKLTYE